MFEKWTLEDTLKEEANKLQSNTYYNDNTNYNNDYFNKDYSCLYDNAGYCSKFN